MIAMYRPAVTADRLRHSTGMPQGIWLPFLLCIAVIGCAPALLGGPGSGGGDPQTEASLRTHMVLEDKSPSLNHVRARMLRHEYLECQLAQGSLHHALSINNPRQAMLWRARYTTVSSSYDLIAAQSTDQVFAVTGLPRWF